MPTLSPQAQFNVAVENPVPQRNVMEDVADAASTVGKIFLTGAQSRKAPDMDAANDRGLVEGLNAAAALRDEGRESEANQMERRVVANYTIAGGNPSSERIQSLILNVTGRDPTQTGFSQEELVQRQMLNDPKFNEAIAASIAQDSILQGTPGYKPKTMAEHQEAAVAIYAQTQANEAMLETAKFAWNTGGKQAVDSAISTYAASLTGMLLFKGQQGENLTLEEVKTTKEEFLAFKTKMLTNVPAENQEEVTKRFAAMQDQIDYLEKNVGAEGINAAATAKWLEQVQYLNISEMEKNAMIMMMSHDSTFAQTFGAVPPSIIRKNLEAMLTMPGNEMAMPQLYDPTFQDPEVQKNQVDMAPEVTFQNARTAITAANSAGQGIVENQTARLGWAQSIVRGLDQTEKLTDSGEWLSAGQYTTMFSPEYFANLEKVKQADPQLHAAITTRTNRVLGKAGQQLEAKVNSMAANSAVEFNVKTGEFRLTRESAAEHLSEQKFAMLDRAVSKWYDGDYDAALADNGKAIKDGIDRAAWEASAPTKEIRAAGNALAAVYAAQAQMAGVTPMSLDNATDDEKRTTSYTVPKDVQKDVLFLKAVADTSTRLNMNPDDLMQAIAFETIGTFSPSIKSGTSNGRGLIQFMPPTARELGTTTDELARMTRHEQMAYVEKYLANAFSRAGVTKPTFGDVYLAIHYPAAIGKGDDYVLYSKNDPNKAHQYSANKSLDSNGDGTVTAGEAVARAAGRVRGVAGSTDMPAGGYGPLSSLMPQAKPLDPSATSSDVTLTSSDGGSRGGADLQLSDSGVGAPQGAPQGGTTQRAEGSAAVAAEMDARALSTLQKMGTYPGDVKMYSSEEAADADSGLTKGELVYINGELLRYNG